MSEPAPGEAAARRADLEARRAATEPPRSILLQAPAGSGKTAVLTQRFLRLLCAVDDPGEILAITFTRKAAAEMRSRVTGALLGTIADSDPCAAELRELAASALRHAAHRGWNLGEDTGVLRIQTIDSFNYWLAWQLPVASRTGGALTVTEVPEELYRRAARRTLQSADAEAQLAADTAVLFGRLDNSWRSVERLLADMLRQRLHWLPHILKHEPHELGDQVTASLAAVVQARLAAARELVPAALRRACESLAGVGALGGEPRDLAAWQRLASLALTAEGRWRRALRARSLGQAYETPAARARLQECIADLAAIAPAEECLAKLAALPEAALSPADREALAALARVLKAAAHELQLTFAAAGRVDYTYVTGAARWALTEDGAPTDLALRTGLALRHILVDEFQDTSLAQFELLRSLTAGWEEGDGRSLFVVGDPMQSIYRFRDAEVGLFLAARDCGIGGVKLASLRLTRNFRSVAPLVAWTNEVFGRLFPPGDDLRAGAVRFAGSVSARESPGSADTAVRLRLYPGDALAEARAIAARVAELHAENPRSSIAILLAAHAHATPIVAALRSLGVDSVGVDLLPLAERPVVRDLVELARALYDLGDRSAWLAVLRAPWCGARLATLTALSTADDSLLIWQALADDERLGCCPPEEQRRLERLRQVLARALERRGREPPADWLETVWVQLGAPDAYASEELEDARAFFEALAERAAGGEWRGPDDFPALLQDLFSAAHAPGGEQAVQIMTIHRAKGLEFDHVLMPALDRSSGRSERPLLRWIDLPRPDGKSDLLMAPVPNAGEEDLDRVSALIAGLSGKRTEHERLRLLYVGATRARQTLELSGAPRRRRDGSCTPEHGTLLASLWPALAGEFREADAPAPALAREGAGAAERSQGPAAATPLRRLKDGWVPPAAEPPPALEHLPLAPGALEPPEFSWVGETQRHIGTLVHALLARAAEARMLPSAREIEEARAGVLEELRRLGVPAAERGAAGQRVIAAVTRMLGDERGRWILRGAHAQAASELALTGLVAGRLRSVVIDRSFVDEAGTRWVIDYKTSRHEGGALEEFLEREEQRYRGQLADYVALARALGPQPVRAALYFPLLGAFREVSV
jgi:ATP-dependent helicase/nuclease subunit A